MGKDHTQDDMNLTSHVLSLLSGELIVYKMRTIGTRLVGMPESKSI